MAIFAFFSVIITCLLGGVSKSLKCAYIIYEWPERYPDVRWWIGGSDIAQVSEIKLESESSGNRSLP